MILLIIFTLIIGYFTLTVCKQYYIYWETRNIPGPVPLPFIGNALELGTNNAEFLINLQKLTQKFGSICRLCIGSQNGVLISDIKYIEQAVLAAGDYEKGDLYKIIKPLVGNGLVTSSGKHWVRQRKILNTAFSNKQLEKYVAAFNHVADKLVNQFKDKVHLEFIDVTGPLFNCTLHSVCKAAMQVDLTEDSEYHIAAYEILNLFFKRFTSPIKRIDFFYRFFDEYKQTANCIWRMRNFVQTVIKNRKQKKIENSDKSILDQLIRLTGDDAITEEEMLDQLQTFVFAGSDTTGTALSFALYELAKHPNIQDKILEEVETISGKDFSFQDVNTLKYTECVLREVMRKYPPIPMFTRIVPKAITLDDFSIPAETSIMVFTHGLHNSEKNFPNPEKFDPDRFLPENWGERSIYSYIPFAVGPRNCIGQKFAMLEAKVVLAKMIRNFRIMEHPGHEPIPELIGTLRSANGLPVTLDLRQKLTT